MALVLLNNNGTPFGQFDGYDTLASSLLGGEVATLVNYGITGTDKKAKDIDDGYSVTGLNTVRPIVTTTLAGSEVGGMLFLTDDGTTNYGTLFGTLVGGSVGQTVTGGTVLGPSTMAGSGKVTLWANPGLYGVTLDALDTGNFNASANLSVGAALSYTSAGKLTLAANKVGSAPNVARFVEFSSGDSLVTTPRSLTRVGVSGGMLQFKYAVIAWHPVIS